MGSQGQKKSRSNSTHCRKLSTLSMLPSAESWLLLPPTPWSALRRVERVARSIWRLVCWCISLWRLIRVSRGLGEVERVCGGMRGGVGGGGDEHRLGARGGEGEERRVGTYREYEVTDSMGLSRS